MWSVAPPRATPRDPDRGQILRVAAQLRRDHPADEDRHRDQYPRDDHQQQHQDAGPLVVAAEVSARGRIPDKVDRASVARPSSWSRRAGRARDASSRRGRVPDTPDRETNELQRSGCTARDLDDGQEPVSLETSASWSSPQQGLFFATCLDGLDGLDISPKRDRWLGRRKWLSLRDRLAPPEHPRSSKPPSRLASRAIAHVLVSRARARFGYAGT